MQSLTTSPSTLGLKALHLMALSRFYDSIGLPFEADDAFLDARELISSAAVTLIYSQSTLAPVVLTSTPTFANWFNLQVSHTIEALKAYSDALALNQASLEKELLAKKTLAERLENNDWAGLGVPTPAELLSQFNSTELNSEKVEIFGHYLSYEHDAMILWYTNPYGHDGCAIAGQLTEERIGEFIKTLAKGIVLGPTPNDEANQLELMRRRKEYDLQVLKETPSKPYWLADIC